MFAGPSRYPRLSAIRGSGRPLAHLLRDFRTGPSQRPPGFPFHHLTSNGLFFDATGPDARPLGTSVGRLRRAGATGPTRSELGTGPDRQLPAARLSQQGPPRRELPTLPASKLLLRLGLELQMVEIADPFRRRRDPAFRSAVLIADEYRCAVCGYDGWLGGEAIGLDAADVRRWAIQGPDSVVVAGQENLHHSHRSTTGEIASGKLPSRALTASRGRAASALVCTPSLPRMRLT